MQLTQPQEPRADIDTAATEVSIPSALERLLAASQGVITKRIDLALLEVQELIVRSLWSAALVTMGVLCTAGAWFSLAAWVVLFVAADAPLNTRIALFAVLNGVAAALVAVTFRWQQRLMVRLNRAPELE